MALIAVDNRLAYYRLAGIARYTRNLVNALQKIENSESFIEWRHRHQPRVRHESPNWISRALISPVHHTWEQRLLQVEMLRFRPDVAHFPDFISPYLTRQKSVITVHDLAFLHWPQLVTGEAKAYYNQLPLAVEHAAAIITPSKFTSKDLLEQLPQAKGKVHVIHSGLSPGFLQEEAKEKGSGDAELDLPRRFLLHVGTLEPRKNIPVLLKAFKIVREMRNQSNLFLVLAGAKGWRDEGIYKLVGKLDLEKFCIFPGRLTDVELQQLYKKALCLVHPALYEGFGFTVLESMACGTPVVCSNAASLTEIAGDAALYANPREEEELANKILDLLQDATMREDQIEKGRARASKFKWEDTAAATLAIYHSVLS